MRLSIRQLDVFLAIVAHRRVSAAAATLHVSQPAVTKTLIELERAVGQRLFERTPRGMVTTPAGEVLARRGEVLRAELRLAVEELGILRAGHGRLRVGATPAAMQRLSVAWMRTVG